MLYLSTTRVITSDEYFGVISLVPHAASFGQLKYLNINGDLGLSFEHTDDFGHVSFISQQYPAVQLELAQKFLPLSIH